MDLDDQISLASHSSRQRGGPSNRGRRIPSVDGDAHSEDPGEEEYSRGVGTRSHDLFGSEDEEEGSHVSVPASAMGSLYDGDLDDCAMRRMRNHVDAIEGFDKRWLGQNVDPRVIMLGPFVQNGKSSTPMTWKPLGEDLLQTEGSVGRPPVPARTLCMNYPSDFWSSTAKMGCDFDNFDDKTRQAQAAASAALTGWLWMGTEKRYANGPHCERDDLVEKGTHTIPEAMEAIDGRVNSYIYHPEWKEQPPDPGLTD